MKNDRLLKILACMLSLVMTCTWAIAQNAPPNPPSNSPQPAGLPGPRGPNPPPQPGGRGDAAVTTGNQGSSFLSTALEINEAEIELGQLAAMKAKAPEVKTYAQMLVKDHTAGLQKLQKLEGGKQEAPTLNSEHQSLKTRLTGMNGAEFDRAYMGAMVDGHRAAVKLFDDEISVSPSRPQPASKPPETEVIAAAKEMLPTIKHHLEEGEKIQKALK